MTTEEINRIMFTKHEWPDFVKALFPAILIFYKPNKSKFRPGITTGWETTGKLTTVGNPKMRKTFKGFKRKVTHSQNQYNVVSCLCTSPNDHGTVARSLKHKGFSKMVALAYATPDEVAAQEGNWRYVFKKYKTFGELYNMRKVWDPRFKDICDRLDEQYSAKSTGQIRLI
jgi:rhodanese-related sulfurtransferase